MNNRIISLGAMYVDINAQNFPFEEELHVHKEIIGEAYEVAPGGSALNFARMCAALELTPTFIGKTGQDSFANILKTLVNAAGVTPAFIEDPSVKTNIGINFINPQGESIMTVVGNANQSLQGEEVLAKLADVIGDAEFLYLGGCFKLKSLMEAYQAIIALAEKHNTKIIVDHGRITNTVTDAEKTHIKELVKFATIYLPSKEEFLQLWNVQTIEEGIEKVRQFTKAHIIIKDAENGVHGYDGKETIHVSSFAVKVSNSVGAGDSFNAGFIAAQAQRRTFEESLRFACATAALKISESTLPTQEKILKLLSR